MRANVFLLLTVLAWLAGCAGVSSSSRASSAPTYESSPEQAQQLMCIEENMGLLRFSRAHLEEFCPKIKNPFELICLRFAHSTKDWHKACPGIDTAEKLECFSTVANGTNYALLASLEKCRGASNRKQIYCLSRKVTNSGIPLQPETVQECLDQNTQL